MYVYTLCTHVHAKITYFIVAYKQWQSKLAKSGGAYLLNRKYLCGQNLKSYGALLKSGGASAP